MSQLLVIVVYLMLLLLVGAFANRVFRGTANDYMLASHSIGPFLLLMSLFGTTMTAFALVGSTGRAYTLGIGVYGLLASASGIVHSLCFFVIGIPLWTYGRKYGYTTQIQYLRDRLQNDVIGWLLFPILIALVIGYLLVGVVGGGEVVQTVTAGAFEAQGWFPAVGHGVPRWLASATICAVVLAYVFFGGMRGTAWANALQTMVFMILGLVTFFVICNALGGADSMIENMQRATQAVPEANLTRGKISYPVFFSFLLIPLSVGMFPHVFQHWLTARSAAAFKLPIVMHPIFIMIVWLPCVMLGVWASAPGSGIEPHTNENLVLGMLVQSHAGKLLGGLLTAGILAAIMSSLDSQFLCAGTMFTEDILRHGGQGAKKSERSTVVAARLFVLAVVLATYLMSLVLPRAVFDLGLWSFSGFTGLFPIVLGAIYWRRFSAAGAIASVVTTVAVWMTLFWRSEFGQNKRYLFPETPIVLWGDWAIPQFLPVVAIFAASLLAMVAVSLITSPPPRQTLDRFFRS